MVAFQLNAKVDESILVGRLNRRPTFEPKMVMKETESCLLQNLKSQLWAIGCVEIFSSIWVAYLFTLLTFHICTLIIHN
jgi:hypothetical protein